MKKILFLAIILIVIIYFQYSFIHQTNDSYEILQYNNPNKDLFENIHQEKLISVFTNIPFDISSGEDNKMNSYSYSMFKNDYLKKNKNKTDRIIQENFSYYDIPLCVSNKIILDFQIFDSTSPLIYQDNYRHLIYQVEGTRRFYIFSPKYHKNLYIKNKKTDVDFWNQDTNKYPLIKDAQYIEVLLHPGQMISIPMKWVYAHITEEDCFTIFYSSESIFSYFLK